MRTVDSSGNLSDPALPGTAQTTPAATDSIQNVPPGAKVPPVPILKLSSSISINPEIVAASRTAEAISSSNNTAVQTTITPGTQISTIQQSFGSHMFGVQTAITHSSQELARDPEIGSKQDSNNITTPIVSVVTMDNKPRSIPQTVQALVVDAKPLNLAQSDQQKEKIATTPQKMELVIDFESLFFKVNYVHRAKELLIQLNNLLRYFNIIFLTGNPDNAKRIINANYQYPDRFNDAPIQAVKFLRKTFVEKRQYIMDCLLEHKSRSSGSKVQTNELRLMLVVVHHCDGLGDVNKKSCQLIKIDQTPNILHNTDNHILALQQLYSECVDSCTDIEEAEKKVKVAKLEKELILLRNDPQFIRKKLAITYTMAELEIIGDLAYVIEREKSRRDIKEFFYGVLPNTLYVVPVNTSAYLFETVCNSLNNYKKELLLNVETLKFKISKYIQDLEARGHNYVKSILSGKGAEVYDEYLKFLDVPRIKWEKEVAAGRATYNGPSQDLLAVDLRLVCDFFKVKIHVVKRINNYVVHFIVDDVGVHEVGNKNETKQPTVNKDYVDLNEIYSLPKCLHICMYEEETVQYARKEFCFMPIMLASEVQANLVTAPSEITYDDKKFEHYIFSRCEYALRIEITNADETFKHFLFALYPLYQNDLIRRAVQPQIVNALNAYVARINAEVWGASRPQSFIAGRASPKTTGSPGSRSQRESMDQSGIYAAGRASPIGGWGERSSSFSDSVASVASATSAASGKKSPRFDPSSEHNSPAQPGRSRLSSHEQLNPISGKASPRPSGITGGQASPRTPDSSVDEPFYVPKSPRNTGSPISKTPNNASMHLSRTSPVIQTEFNDYIRVFAPIFKNNLAYNDDFNIFIRQLFLILVCELANKVKVILDNYALAMKENSNFAANINKQFIWASSTNEDAMLMESFNFLTKIRSILFIWFDVIRGKVDTTIANSIGKFVNPKNKREILDYILVMLTECRANLLEQNVKNHEEYDGFLQQIDAKSEELAKCADAYNSLLLSTASLFAKSAFLNADGDIFTLCKNGQLSALIKAIDNEQRAGFGALKFDINAPSKRYGKFGNNLLQIACSMGHHEIVRHLIAERKADVKYRTSDIADSPPLFYIISHLNTDENGYSIIDHLLEAGAQTVVFDPLGRTPLHIADKIPTGRILEYLTQKPGKLIEVLFVKSKPHERRPNEPACTSLFHSLIIAKLEIVKIYYSYGRILTSDEINDLFQGKRSDAINLIKTILTQKIEEYNVKIGHYDAEMKLKDFSKDKSSPVKIPSSKRGEMLLSARARDMIIANQNLDVRNEESELMHKLGVERAPLERTVSVRRFFSMFVSPSESPLKAGRVSVGITNSQLLADDRSRSSSGSNTPLISPRSTEGQPTSPRSHRAEIVGPHQTISAVPSSEMAALRLPLGNSVEEPDKTGNSPSTPTGKDSNTKLSLGEALKVLTMSPPPPLGKVNPQVETVILKEPSPDNYNLLSEKTGFAPIHIACILGNKALLAKLIQMNVDLSVCSAEGFTPLYYAVLHGHKDIVELLKGANAPLLPNPDDLKDLLQKEEEKIKLIRDRPRESQDRNNPLFKRKMHGWSRTPLHAAAERNDAILFVSIYNYAIEKRCYECIYRRDEDNYSPLTRAAILLNREIEEFCRDKGFWLTKVHDEDDLQFKLKDPISLREIFSMLKEVVERQLDQITEIYNKTFNISPRNSRI